jgi:phosphatidate cytidylyltransferase
VESGAQDPGSRPLGSGAPLETVHPKAPTPPPPERRRWRPSNLTLRLLTAGMLIPPVLWVTWVGGVAFVAVVVGISVIGVNEFYNFIGAKGATPHRLLGTLAAGSLPVIAYIGDAFWATNLMTIVLLGVMILQLAKREIQEAIASVSATFFGVFYVGWLMAHAVFVRFIQPDLVQRYGETAAVAVDPDIGIFFMALCIASAIVSDTGGYVVGRAYGRRRLAPAISPNKSVEGALGGLLFGSLIAVATKLFFDAFVPGDLARDFSVATAALFGLVISAVSILGDLIESLLKRDADLKDAGAILPGVGGLLDRIDSALLAIPVTYYLLLAYYYGRLGS